MSPADTSTGPRPADPSPAAAAQPGRRSLELHDLDAVVREARLLDQAGYIQVGKWNLAQTCLHLEDWLRYAVDGYPKPPLPVALIMSVMRLTMGRSLLRKTLATRTLPANAPTAPHTVHAAGEASDTAAVEKLAQTIQRFQAHTGPYHPSPLFGPLDHDTALQLQIVHCAHHLSFLIPRTHAGENARA